MDERTCAAVLFVARDGICDRDLPRAIMDRKATLFREYTTIPKPALFPGAVEFVKRAGARYRLAIASGGRREQIDAALAGTAIEQEFELVVSAEDCPIGKPDPAIYRITCDRLNAAGATSQAITPAQCLVIEDSLVGFNLPKLPEWLYWLFQRPTLQSSSSKPISFSQISWEPPRIQSFHGSRH